MAGLLHADAVAFIEQDAGDQVARLLGPADDEDVLGIHLDRPLDAEVTGHGLAQFHCALQLGIVGRVAAA